MAGLTRFVSVERDGLTLLVATWDRGVGRKLFVSRRRKEMGTLERALAALGRAGGTSAGSTFLDVGANIGTTCLPALAWHGFARAVAIEPDPENARILRAAAALNGLEDRLTVVEAAAGAAAGQVELLRSQRNSGAHRLARPGEEGITVEATTLDALAEAGIFDPEQVGLLWMDAQGSEGAILSGAGRLTDRHTPFVAEVGMGERLDAGSYSGWVDLRDPNLAVLPLPIDVHGRRFADVLVV